MLLPSPQPSAVDPQITPLTQIPDSPVEVERGRWIDPRGAEAPLADWAEEFLSLCRRLAPTTREIDRRASTRTSFR
jgi:hypothetical protein